MIYLTKGQIFFENPGMVVYEKTGYYNDGDSIICASVAAPEEPVCRFEAQFVAYGGMVYSVSDPDKLMEEVMRIDPKSLFGKDSKQVAVDKIVEEIVPQETGALVETPVVEKKEEEPVISTSEVEHQNPATTTPAVVFPETATTTSPVSGLDPVISTTTPTFITPIEERISTTTPEFTLPGISTTTPIIDALIDNTSTTTPESLISEILGTIPETIATSTETAI